VEVPELVNKPLQVGDEYTVVVRLDNVGNETGFGVELVIYHQNEDNTSSVKTVEMNQIKTENESITFRMSYKLTRAGSFSYALRIFPKHPDLPHRQDFCYVKWEK